jgi:hypothetical protein
MDLGDISRVLGKDSGSVTTMGEYLWFKKICVQGPNRFSCLVKNLHLWLLTVVPGDFPSIEFESKGSFSSRSTRSSRSSRSFHLVQTRCQMHFLVTCPAHSHLRLTSHHRHLRPDSKMLANVTCVMCSTSLPLAVTVAQRRIVGVDQCYRKLLDAVLLCLYSLSICVSSVHY